MDISVFVLLGQKITNHAYTHAKVHVNFSLWIIFNLYHFNTQEKGLEAYIYQVLDRLDWNICHLSSWDIMVVQAVFGLLFS